MRDEGSGARTVPVVVAASVVLVLAVLTVWWGREPVPKPARWGLPLVHTAPRIPVTSDDPPAPAPDAAPRDVAGLPDAPSPRSAPEPVAGDAVAGLDGGRAVVESSSGRWLHLRLVDVSGDPVSGAVLQFEAAGGGHLPVVVRGELSTGAESGREGEVLVEGLPAMRVGVRAYRPEAQFGLLPATLGSFDLTEPIEDIQVIVLPDPLPVRSIHVTVRSASTPRPVEFVTPDPEHGGFAYASSGPYDRSGDLLVPLDVRVLHDGLEIATGNCWPAGDRNTVCATFLNGLHGLGMPDTPFLGFRLWQIPLRFEFDAVGHRPQTVDLEPGDGDVMLVVTLVRDP